MGFFDRLQHGWNAFINNRDPTAYNVPGPSYRYRPDRPRFSRGNERSIVNAILNKMAMDVAAIDILHVRLDKDGRYVEDIKSGLNECLTVEANLDQSGRMFRQNLVMSMFDEGVVAAVPVDTSIDPRKSGSYDIHELRAGKITEWFPKHVKIQVYNPFKGDKDDVVLPKRTTAIIENPLYTVMNEPNSTLQRLIRKLNLLDAIDEQSGSGKLDLIIQLPYVIKTPQRQKQAEDRMKSIEDQLRNSPFGIAYTDGTERVTQLNRPIENNLMKQIEYLTALLYSQLVITQSIMDGSASEQEMLNYYSRTIEPIISAITDEFRRKFITKTGRAQGQSILFFRDPFKLVPMSQIANIGAQLISSEILSPNEIRPKIGFKPVQDERADQLANRNITPPTDPSAVPPEGEMMEEPAQEDISTGDMPISEIMN